MASPVMIALSSLLVPLAARAVAGALVSKQSDNLQSIERIIECWRAILGSLTNQQKANLEQQKPGALSNVYQTLNECITVCSLCSRD